MPNPMTAADVAWLATLRKEAMCGAVGIFPIQTAKRGPVAIWYDDITSRPTDEELWTFLEERCNEPPDLAGPLKG